MQLRRRYTLLIIAHRFSTIKHADRVVVLRQGRIEQIRTYEELVARFVSFKKMVTMQKM